MSAFNMAQGLYQLHYETKMAPNLTPDQKEEIAKRISKLTLRGPIWDDPEKDYRDQFPEIAPYITKGVPLSGLYLISIMESIISELQGTVRP